MNSILVDEIFHKACCLLVGECVLRLGRLCDGLFLLG